VGAAAALGADAGAETPGAGGGSCAIVKFGTVKQTTNKVKQTSSDQRFC